MAFRDVRFDPRLGKLGSLVETPIAEYTQLRGNVIGNVRDFSIPPGMTKVVALKPSISAADIEINVTAGPGPSTLRIGAACDPVAGRCGFGATLALGAAGAGGARSVALTIDNSHASMTFPMLAGERVLPIRIMTDTRSVEFFAGHGRGVFSGALSYAFCAACPCAVTASSSAPGTTAFATAWGINTIF